MEILASTNIRYIYNLYQIVLMPIAEPIFYYICYEFILQIIDMVKISISAANILANPIIGTPLINIIKSIVGSDHHFNHNLTNSIMH